MTAQNTTGRGIVDLDARAVQATVSLVKRAGLADFGRPTPCAGWSLAGLIGHMGGPTLTNGVISGALVWLGFVITTIAVNNAFQRKKPMLTVIDGGHWLAVLLLQGVVLGLLR